MYPGNAGLVRTWDDGVVIDWAFSKYLRVSCHVHRRLSSPVPFVKKEILFENAFSFRKDRPSSSPHATPRLAALAGDMTDRVDTALLLQQSARSNTALF